MGTYHTSQSPVQSSNFPGSTATDLESFSRHAGRSTVTTDDVLLLARKNPDLHGLVKDYVDELNAKKVENGKGKGKAGR